MNNYEKFKKLMDEFEIEYKEENDDKIKSIKFESGNKICAYVGFCANFEFDETGKFIEMGIWEE